MKRLVSIVLLAMLCSVAPPAKGNPTGDAPPEPADQCQPPAVVASFLDFTDAQAAQFEDLLTQLQTTVYGLQQQIATLQTQLDSIFTGSTSIPPRRRAKTREATQANFTWHSASRASSRRVTRNQPSALCILGPGCRSSAQRGKLVLSRCARDDDEVQDTVSACCGGTVGHRCRRGPINRSQGSGSGQITGLIAGSL